MNHNDHIDLLRDGILETGGTWADLGAGSGVFTLALADLIGPDGEIYAVDMDRNALSSLERAMRAHFPATTLQVQAADFNKPLDLPLLNGVVMANSLHFFRKKVGVVAQIRQYLRPGGCLLLVEYDTDRGNFWVPHPVSYPAWEALATRAGFSHTRLLTTKPSRFLGRIYSALSV